MELNFYKSTVNIIIKAMEQTQGAIFSGASTIFNGALSAIILGLVTCFWVYMKMGSEWSRQDFFKAGVWLTIYVCLKVIFSNYENYLGFLQIINTPIQWVYGALSGAGVDDITEGMDKAFMHLGNSLNYLWEQISFFPMKKVELLVPIIFIGLVGTLNIIWLALFSIISKFTVTLVLSLCPLVLPLLAINPLRGYFFSWFKLYISVSMYIPLASVIGNLTTKATGVFPVSDTVTTTEIFNNTFGIVLISILSVLTISQIPNFVQQIIGASGGMMGTGMSVVGSNFAKNYSEARNSINANTGAKNSVLRSATAGAVGTIPGLSGLSQRVMGRDSASMQRRQEKLQSGQFGASPTPYNDKKGKK